MSKRHSSRRLPGLITRRPNAQVQISVAHPFRFDHGDRVAVRTTMQATHQGEFFGIAPTFRPVSVPSMHILRVRDGRIVEHWGNEDAIGMLTQLGVMPALTPA